MLLDSSKIFTTYNQLKHKNQCICSKYDTVKKIQFYELSDILECLNAFLIFIIENIVILSTTHTQFLKNIYYAQLKHKNKCICSKYDAVKKNQFNELSDILECLNAFLIFIIENIVILSTTHTQFLKNIYYAQLKHKKVDLLPTKMSLFRYTSYNAASSVAEYTVVLFDWKRVNKIE